MTQQNKLFLVRNPIRSSKADLLNRLAKEEDGIAAIEFALLAPVMFAIYFGVSVISLAIAADRDLSHATNVIADLATQESQLTQTMIENIMTAGVAVVGASKSKYDENRITIELISYEKNSGTINQIGYARLGPAIGTYNTSKLTSNDRLLSDSSGVVVARISYKYDMPIGNNANFKLSESFVLKPRKSETVPFGTGINGGYSFTSCSVAQDYSVTGC